MITAHLVPADTAHAAVDPDDLNRLLRSATAANYIEHTYTQLSPPGLAVVLFSTAPDLATAERTARLAMQNVIDTSADMRGWEIKHCAADVITAALDELFRQSADE